MFSSLRHRNYRLFYLGQSISLIGTWMQQTALAWLVYRLSGSPVWLGIAAFAGQAPHIFLAPFAGVFVDRWSRHRILMMTQILSMIQATILTILVATGHATVEVLALLGFCLGIINTFDVPARQAFLVEMIANRDDLPNAIGLNSTLFNGTRLIGPSLAGLLIAAWGESICFAINAFSYLAVIVCLSAMTLKPHPLPKGSPDVFRELKEGLAYVRRSMPIRSILFLIALVSLVGIPFNVLMPVFAREILDGGPRLQGFLMAASGVGALLGAITMASRKSIAKMDDYPGLALLIFGFGVCGFSLSRSLPVSLIFLAVSGYGIIIQMAASNTLIQTIVSDEMRGRVMGFYTMAFLGVTPLGSLLYGWMAHFFGPVNAVLTGGAICLAGAAWFLRKERISREG